MTVEDFLEKTEDYNQFIIVTGTKDTSIVLHVNHIFVAEDTETEPSALIFSELPGISVEDVHEKSYISLPASVKISTWDKNPDWYELVDGDTKLYMQGI